MRDEILKKGMSELLSRLNAPRSVAQKPDMAKKEAQFLLKSVQKLAPTRNVQEWFDQFQDQLLSTMDTRSWPTVKAMGEAARAIAPKRPEFRDLTGEAAWKVDSDQVEAKRIKNQEAVSTYYLEGKGAERLLRKGLVVEEDFYPYREALVNIANFNKQL